MSQSREVVPGATYLMTRRSVCRFFLFKPDQSGRLHAAFVYLLAYCAAFFGLEVHAGILMSTHLHLVITDTRGVYPDFLESFHRLFACVTKAYRGWGGEVFNKSQTSMVELTSAAVVLEKMAYTLVNASAAGAVRMWSDWPGFVTRIHEIGSTLAPKSRPTDYLRDHELFPESTSLTLVWPKIVLDEYGSEEAARQALRAAVAAKQAEAHLAVKEAGWTYLGADRCVKVSFTKRATQYEAWGRRNPTFATGKDRELFFEMVERRRTFRGEYAIALMAWVAGDRMARFPAYTWKMRVLHGARCHPPPLGN